MVKQVAKYPRIIFSGNSLSWYSGGNLAYGMRMPTTCYNASVAAGKVHAMHNFSTGGIQTSQMITNYPTLYAPYIKAGDIVIFWELVNDLRVLDNETTAYNNVVTYTDLIRASGAKVVLVDAIANDFSGNPVGFDTKRQTLNTNLYTNRATLCDVFIQASAITELDTVADTVNATYYNADLIHLTDAGYDLVGNLIYTGIASIL